MLRNIVSRSARTVVVQRSPMAAAVPRSLVAQFVRLNSTNAPPPQTASKSKADLSPEEKKKKEILEQQDNLRRDWDAKVISYEELLPKTQNPSADAYLIDVREPNEVIQGMIPSAVNLPLSVLPAALNLPPSEFQTTHGFPKPKTAQEITFYCRSGMRSSTACDVAKRNGFTNLLNYKGSWLEWSEKQGIKPSS